jgi:hypothetical protein
VQPEEVFRNANERVAETARQLRLLPPIPFLCECSDRRCFAHIQLSLAEYDEVRSHRQTYLIVPGHEVSNAFLIEQDDRFALVEKLYANVDSR